MAKCAEGQAFRKACPGLTKKLQAAGAQVIDAEYLIYKADQIQREDALPRRAIAGDLDTTLYKEKVAFGHEDAQPGQEESHGPGESKGDKKEPPVRWTPADKADLKAAVEKSELSSSEWRGLLGLAEDAKVKDVEALGSVQQVIKLLAAAFANALAGEPTEQSELGF